MDQNPPPKSVARGAWGGGTNQAQLTQPASHRPCPAAGPVVPAPQPRCRGWADLDPPRAGNSFLVMSDKPQSFSAVLKTTNSFYLIYLILGNIFNFWKSILMPFCSFICHLHYYLIPAWLLPVQLVEHSYRSFFSLRLFKPDWNDPWIGSTQDFKINSYLIKLAKVSVDDSKEQTVGLALLPLSSKGFCYADEASSCISDYSSTEAMKIIIKSMR